MKSIWIFQKHFPTHSCICIPYSSNVSYIYVTVPCFPSYCFLSEIKLLHSPRYLRKYCVRASRLFLNHAFKITHIVQCIEFIEIVFCWKMVGMRVSECGHGFTSIISDLQVHNIMSNWLCSNYLGNSLFLLYHQFQPSEANTELIPLESKDVQAKMHSLWWFLPTVWMESYDEHRSVEIISIVISCD